MGPVVVPVTGGDGHGDGDNREKHKQMHRHRTQNTASAQLGGALSILAAINIHFITCKCQSKYQLRIRAITSPFP